MLFHISGLWVLDWYLIINRYYIFNYYFNLSLIIIYGEWIKRNEKLIKKFQTLSTNCQLIIYWQINDKDNNIIAKQDYIEAVFIFNFFLLNFLLIFHFILISYKKVNLKHWVTFDILKLIVKYTHFNKFYYFWSNEEFSIVIVLEIVWQNKEAISLYF